ncbi:sulfur oxidation c-type cytochrome SoxX [Polynucleobacter sp. AP-Kolm-20A-A1]|uniref:sulfur oxidation c-type cytochrome SoxX n=1 Tax=Polynucleobacter sp. AP-Kolm-20A-A1 TaxID=2081041 RepID=UPI001BFDEE4F|nr:sulfur oxidation c-type cytochrome SoxX [Polynucleobacter sp. AP-Kolm-20A-A1]QWE19912.1 sulfur oxidation c-type cytochrome SoxX [Polynucleobacter sp. AP-Kolm-20A-A1]
MRKRYVPAIFLLGILNLSLVGAQTVSGVQAEGVNGGGAVLQPLTSTPGDPIRGRAIVANRQTGLCLLCHSGPFPEERFQGNLAPELSVSAGRYTVPELRARIMDASRFNPNTIMPSYYRDDHLYRVAAKFKGETILSGQEIEDVVAFLASMNNSNPK